MQLIRRLYQHIATEGMGRALRYPHYRIYSATDLTSNVGNWAYRVGLGWLAWDLTHSGFWLGFIAIAGALPSITLLPLMGAFADRVDRLKIMRWSQFIGFIFAALLTVFTFTGWINIYSLSLLTFLSGFIHTVSQPARMVMPPNLVPKEAFAAAIGFAAALHSASRFLGPAIGGFVIGAWGVGFIFLFNTLSYLIFLFGLNRIVLLTQEISDEPRKSGILGDTMAGLRYALGHANISPLVILMILSAVLTRPFGELLPGFNDAIFRQGPEELGMLLAAFGMGGIGGSVWVANMSRTRGLFNLTLVYLVIFIVLLMVFATTSWFVLALAMVAGMGFATAVYQATSNVLIQNMVDGAMRARVMSIYALSYRAGPALGALIMGSASTYFGLQVPVIAGGLIFTAILLVFAPRRRQLSEAFDNAVASR